MAEDFTIRRATKEDAPAIQQLAMDVTRRKMESEGLSEEDISNQGFLMSPGPPEHYAGRMTEHFWVATQNDRVAAFVLAFSFEKMREFEDLTPDDIDMINCYTGRGDVTPQDVIVDQVATHPDFKGQGLMSTMLQTAFNKDNVEGSRIIAEVASAPLPNIASKTCFSKNGFSPQLERVKNAHDPDNQRLYDSMILDL